MPQPIVSIRRRPEPSLEPEPLGQCLVREQEYPEVAGVDLTRLPRHWSRTQPHRLRWRTVAEVCMGAAILAAILAAMPALWLAWWVGWMGR